MACQRVDAFGFVGVIAIQSTGVPYPAMRNPLELLSPRRSRRMRQQTALESLSQVAALAPNLRELQLRLASEFCGLGRAELAAFLAHDPLRKGYVEVQSTHPVTPDLVLRAGGPLIRWLEVNEEPIAFPDPRGAHEVLGEDEREQFAQYGIKACVPLVSVSRLVGVVALCSSSPTWRLKRADIAFLNTCARQAALACEAAGRRGHELEHVQATHRAQQLVMAGQLAAAVAHEVRNPLAAVRSTLQFARSEASPKAGQQELIDDVLVQIDRIDETMSGILRLSRPDTVERVEVDLVSVVGEALTQLDSYARPDSIAIETNLDVRPLPVLGDAAELRSVFLNLFVNACNAMSTGGQLTVRSSMSKRPLAAGAPVARIDVEDTGAGMTAETLARVFEPFYTTRSSGTGLGLPICLEIVQRHGGELKLASEPEHGTVVTVLIPVRPVS